MSKEQTMIECPKNQALLQVVGNEPSYCFGTAQTRVCLTRMAGMMAPVTFFNDTDHPVQPYAIAPWRNEGVEPGTPTLLALLRGDFFCAPFGGNDEPVGTMQYPPHGETANEAWELTDFTKTEAGEAIHMTQTQKTAPGTVRKSVAVAQGQNVVYTRHKLTGFEGPMCVGHHPNLFVPDGVEPGRLSFAPHRHAHTYVNPTEEPINKGYSALVPDTVIDDLTRCPTLDGKTTDLTRWPARRGYEDIVLLAAEKDLALGWTAFALPALGYVWFSLKDPAVLASTLLWMSNGGRHFPPWNGRHINTIGLEEVTGFFHEGMAASARKNFLSDMGVPTTLALRPETAVNVNLIQGVARINPDFIGVRAIEARGTEGIRIVGEGGDRIDVEVDLSFLKQGMLKDLIA